ncbi:hypothetical protein CHARACLAT_025295 [Characodon lateralis]|uniref:Uncharacterized protein n=1 Tax=Characodon lateralis TaxID=208331 RepID=A0ABU7DBT4_9TELE|nr:hypothetical protein [Characodon lateralis]
MPLGVFVAPCTDSMHHCVETICLMMQVWSFPGRVLWLSCFANMLQLLLVSHQELYCYLCEILECMVTLSSLPDFLFRGIMFVYPYIQGLDNKTETPGFRPQ